MLVIGLLWAPYQYPYNMSMCSYIYMLTNCKLINYFNKLAIFVKNLLYNNIEHSEQKIKIKLNLFAKLSR
jgi:hypothetical protein